MNKEFVLYEQALELKELGFDEECLGFYDYYTKGIPLMIYDSQSDCGGQPAPLYQQAFRWFREKYELSSWIYNSYMDKYFYTVLENGKIVKANEPSTTYEEAELACLKRLIEIVKNK